MRTSYCKRIITSKKRYRKAIIIRFTWDFKLVYG